MKKIAYLLPVIVLNLFINSAYAEPYYGVHLGGNIYEFNKDLTFADSRVNHDDVLTGLKGQLVFGYNFHFNDEGNAYGGDDGGYLGIEASVSHNSGKPGSRFTHWFGGVSADSKESLRFTYDLFALFNVKYAGANLFIGPGVSSGDFDMRLDSVTGGDLGISESKTERLYAWSIKAGVGVPICSYMDAVVSLQYSNFEDTVLSRIEPLTEEKVTVTYRPRIYSVTVGLNFH